jgi:lipid II:glycine glycyltransferase (peptidoglycan interpeptide bridge formation enzyme)
MLVRRVPLIGGIAHLDRGPLMVEETPRLYEEAVEAIRRCVHDEHIRLLVLQPTTELSADAMKAVGFSPTDLDISLPATVQVDLSQSEDELLRGMSRQTRQNVRRGMQSGVVIREGSAEDLGTFHPLLEVTARRKRFTPNTLQYFSDLYDDLGRSSGLEMYLAEDEAGPIAGLMLVAFGHRAVCKRAAWSGRAGELRPNEALHRTAMRRARQRGIRFYDFDGVDPAVARAVCAGGSIPPHAVDSVSRFKLGFGGDIVFRPDTLWFVPGALGSPPSVCSNPSFTPRRGIGS